MSDNLMDIDQQAVEIIRKQGEFMGFFYSAFKNYWYTLIFILILTVLILGLRYVHHKLQYSETKLIINWFGILIIVNVILTYVIIITYRQVKVQPGIPGPRGIQGPIGNIGDSDYCTQCSAKIPVNDPVYQDPPVKQPLLPDSFNPNNIKLLTDEEIIEQEDELLQQDINDPED